MNNSQNKKPELSDVRFVHEVSVGSVNPNNLLSDEARQTQTAFLNRCLSDYPKGIIIGRDIAIGRYMFGEHELIMQKTVYHVGFPRRPAWFGEGA